jgi:hypothetical protein
MFAGAAGAYFFLPSSLARVSPEEFRSQLTLVSSDSWPQFIGAADGRACLQCESLFELPAIITRKPALVVLWTDLSELTPQERAMLERGGCRRQPRPRGQI